MKLLDSFIYSLAALCMLSLAPEAQAQEFGRLGDINTSGTSYHVFARPGEATVQVQVIGTVGQSGLYEVSANTDLGRLLTLTGGPPLTSPNPNVERNVTVRLYRLQSASREVIYEAPYEEVLEEPGRYPALKDGDVITVETIERQRFTWRNALSIVGSVAGVLLVIDRLFGIFGGN